MAFDPNSEIFHDFLQEAGELLEGLNEQLVDLESNPDDSEALNAVFRAFHTIKGGAGFLELSAIVELCHRSEDLFGKIREGQLQLTQEVMDPVLAAVDELNTMFEALQEGVEPASAPAEVLQQLEAMLHGGGAEAAPVEVVAEPEPVVTETVSHSAEDGDDDITDDEFEALLDQLDDSSEGDDLSSSAGFVTDVLLGGDPNDDITDDEFDLLLDALDGEDSPGDVP